MSAVDLLTKLISDVKLAPVAKIDPSSVSDLVWAPAVPRGHTEFSWTGVGGSGYVATVAVATAAPKKSEPKESEPKKEAPKQEKKPKKEKKPKQQKPVVPEMPLFYQLDIVVGKILECEKHPDAESLYVEKIDLGEGEPRTIVSGLVNYIPVDQMIGSYCFVVKNLKPAKMPVSSPTVWY